MSCSSQIDKNYIPEQSTSDTTNETVIDTAVFESEINTDAVGGPVYYKHVDYFDCVDPGFLYWCQLDGKYLPEGTDTEALLNDYIELFDRTEDFHNSGFMDYYGIPSQAYIEYWTLKEEAYVKNGGDSETFKFRYATELAFDAWFSSTVIPADQPVFINQEIYTYDDPISVFIRCEEDTLHTNRYYTINGFLVEYVGEEKFQEFKDKYAGTQEFNIISFVDYFDITKEEFDSVFESKDYHDWVLPYHSEYIYGNEEMQKLYFERQLVVE